MNRSNRITVARHADGQYEVVAYDIVGRKVGHRLYRHGRKRKSWAMRQARLWSERFYIYFDPRRDFTTG